MKGSANFVPMKQPFQPHFAAAGAMWVALGIAVSAIGVHALEARGLVEGAERWALAGRYAVTMGVGMLALSVLRAVALPMRKPWPERLLMVGLLGFSGGLLVKGVAPDLPLGSVIPVGGTLLIAGWFWAAGQILLPPPQGPR